MRSYAWAAPGPRVRRPSNPARAVPWVLAAATVLSQIAYPLLDDEPLHRLTAVSVALFFLASVSHAWVWRGAAWALTFVVVSVGTGLAVEVLGERTGYPFGEYGYANSLGAKVLGVPWVIPLAWSMMAYPALIAGRRLVRSRRLVPLVAGFALAAWDVFLDPQMVGEGHWAFASPTPSPPLVDGIPWTNFGGWLIVAVLLMAVLDRLPRTPADDRQPALLYLWTYASSVLANAVFFDRPGVAIAGGVVMGVVAIPYAWALWSDRA